LKKSLAILLLFSLAAPFWGTYIFLQHKRNEIRNEIARIISKNPAKENLVLFKFTASDVETRLDWKDDHEFEFNGKMFDIVTQGRVGDTILYYCYKDEKETKLNKDKHQLLARSMGQDPARKSQAERLTDFFKSLFSQDAFSWNIITSSFNIIRISIFDFQYVSTCLAPPSPPPKSFWLF